MIYVMSDIHGNFEKYSDMLEKLSLKDTDALFILGDAIDGGKDGIKILKDMMYRPNVYPVLGEHEYLAKKLLPVLQNAQTAEECASLTETEEDKKLFARWIKIGGYPTLEAFLKLNEEEKESVLDYLSEFAPYDEVEAGGRDFVLVHAGIRGFEEGKDLDEYDEEDFVSEKADYSSVYFKDKFLITGHTPTGEIGGKDGKVFSAKRHLAIDSSENRDGRLSAVCLDTMKIYYV